MTSEIVEFAFSHLPTASLIGYTMPRSFEFDSKNLGEIKYCISRFISGESGSELFFSNAVKKKG